MVLRIAQTPRRKAAQASNPFHRLVPIAGKNEQRGLSVGVHLDPLHAHDGATTQPTISNFRSYMWYGAHGIGQCVNRANWSKTIFFHVFVGGLHRAFAVWSMFYSSDEVSGTAGLSLDPSPSRAAGVA